MASLPNFTAPQISLDPVTLVALGIIVLLILCCGGLLCYYCVWPRCAAACAGCLVCEDCNPRCERCKAGCTGCWYKR